MFSWSTLMRESRDILEATLARASRTMLLLVLATTAWSQESTDQGSVEASFDNADIRMIIAAVGEVTDKKFIIHPDVDAQVTLNVATPVSVSEFYDMFLSMLHAHGYETVSIGEVVHVVPLGTEAGAGTTAPKARKNVELLEGAIRITPHTVNGQLSGYRVYPGLNRTKFDSLGFRPGDIVTEYDGVPLDNTSTFVRFIGSLIASDVKHVTVIRSDKSVVIQLD